MIIKTIKDGKFVEEEFSGKFDFETDLLVAGLGTAGAVCFYNAVKNGVKCIGVEKQNILGGTATSACVQDYYYGHLSGSLKKINKAADVLTQKSFSPARSHPSEYSVSLSAKTVALESAENSDSAIALGCVITGVIMNEKTVVGIRAFYRKRFINIKTKIIADNTNGFVCTLAGGKTIGGRKSDNKTMRASKTVSFLQNGKTNGEWCSLGFIDGLDEYELTEKYLKAETTPPILLEKYEDNKRPVFEGTMIGKRETARIRTKYDVTFDDLINFKKHEKPIFYGFSSFDNTNEDLELENENLQNWISICYMRHTGLTYCVPFESILPKRVKGIMVIGKALGATHEAASLLRMKAEMEKCGEAAAYIAMLAIKNDCDVADIDYATLKTMLTASGCLKEIPLSIFDLRKNENGAYENIELPNTKEEVLEGLKSEKPQFALFAVLKSNGKYNTALYSALKSEDKTLKTNSAIALGLLKDEKCLPYLREIISAEPDVHKVSNGKHYFDWLEQDLWSNFIKAVILLGRMKDTTSLETLKRLKNKDFNETLKSLRIYQYIDEAIKAIKKG